jgi:hypothetical protein
MGDVWVGGPGRVMVFRRRSGRRSLAWRGSRRPARYGEALGMCGSCESMALSCTMEDAMLRLRNIAFRLLPLVVVEWATVTVLGGALYLAKHADTPDARGASS